MRLADYIERNSEAIVDEAEAFAGSQLTGRVTLDSATLRDHIPQILEIIVADLRSSQTAQEEREKAEGLSDTSESSPKSPAQWHGQLRARSGFSIEHLMAEYRVLRAAVLRLWSSREGVSAEAFEDMQRFNQAIDQAIAESVAHYAAEVETWRNIFLGVLGHDLRGPVTTILLASGLLTKATENPSTTRLASLLAMSGERLARLLDDLLDFSHTTLGSGVRISRADTDVAAELRDEIEMLRLAWPEASIDFQAPDSARACVDASRVRESLANLVNNAIKHGTAPGSVSVVLAQEGDNTLLTVENHGAAIPPALLATMFDPLRRGASADIPGDHSGLGLGLFVVSEVVKAHGGEVTVRSISDSTSFTMRLPSAPTAEVAT
ncbi:ATP-binding protein [Luteimonas sp. A611]